ncbi:MAG: DUF3306 domain-containing protein [Alphaproteobacteria bacterium]|nr:DUF3306 domain-containing protein [Alphaproteobacteria bacterium]
MSGDRGEPAIGRWSRLKRESRDAEREKTQAAAPPAEEGADAKAAAEDPTAGLPDIETLDRDSDYTGFLRAGVPEEMTRRALQKLWRSDPVLANLDGLNDYDEDFVAEMKEGIAIMRRVAEEEAKKLERELAARDDAPEKADAEDDAVGGAAPPEDGSDSPPKAGPRDA